MSIDGWMSSLSGLITFSSEKDRKAAQGAIADCVSSFEISNGEAPVGAAWVSLEEPKLSGAMDTVIVTSPHRLVMSRAGGWTRQEWWYWAGLGAITGASVSGWTYQQSDGWGNHSSNSYLRFDFMLKNLESLTFYKSFDQPKDLVFIARVMKPIIDCGIDVQNDSQEFLLAYNAINQ